MTVADHAIGECSVPLMDGFVAYRFVVQDSDGRAARHYKPGHAIKATPKMETASFRVLRIEAHSAFGIGIDVGF